ncbi:MAG: hypothetical protein ACN4GZ_12835, partial [Acidimicrobiales bacterium]
VYESDAPFGAALQPALLTAFVDIWGPAAAPALVQQFRIDQDRDIPAAETSLRLLAEMGPAALQVQSGNPIALPIAQLYLKATQDDWYQYLGLDNLALFTLRSVTGEDLGEDPDAWLAWSHGEAGAPSLEEQLEVLVLDSLLESGFTAEEAQCLLKEIGVDSLFAWDASTAALTAASTTCGVARDRLDYLKR